MTRKLRLSSRTSRDVDKFARVLASAEGLEYLRGVKRPTIDKAFIISGGDKEELSELLSTASLNIQEALSTIHHHKSDEKIIKIAKRLIENANQIRLTLGLE